MGQQNVTEWNTGFSCIHKIGREEMRFLAKLFGAKPQANERSIEHAVIVNFGYGGSTDLEPLHTLESELESAITSANAGEYDGNEIAVDGSDGILYMYGPDADKLFDAVRPTLESCLFMKEAVVRLRYGPPGVGAQEREVILAP